VLAFSLWISYLLRFDFQVPAGEQTALRRLGLLIIPLQMVFLMWRRQLVGLLSYFDVPEMKQLAHGLGLAACTQLFAWYVTSGDLMPPRSVIVIDGAVAFLLLAGVRLWLRGLREKRTSQVERAVDSSGRLRVGIVGAGELGRWLAQQLNVRGKGHR